MANSKRGAAIAGVVVVLAVAMYLFAGRFGSHVGILGDDGPDDDERPPIIVSNGGSVVIESQLHPKGSGRGRIQPGSGGSYTVADGSAGRKRPKHITVSVFGADVTSACPQDSGLDKVTNLTIQFGPSGMANPPSITVADVDASNGSDLQLTIPDGQGPKLNSLGYLLELQPGNAVYLLSTSFNYKGGVLGLSDKKAACTFSQQTADQAIVIEQKKG